MSHLTPSAAPTDFESIFELAPVSLWLEDFSELKRFFDRLRSQGVQDLAAHLAQHPEQVAEGAACIRVLRVNAKTLSLFGATDADHLLANLGQVFRDDMFPQVVAEWSQLWNGQHEFVNQTVNYTLDGRRLDVLVRARILQGHEAD